MTALDTSPVGFGLNPKAGIDDTIEASFRATTAALGPRGIFEGPYEINGQRDRDGDGHPDSVQAMRRGERPSPDEYGRMCWFARGIVEKSDPLDPTSADVDAKVPDGEVPPPPDVLPPLGAPKGTHLRCSENI